MITPPPTPRSWTLARRRAGLAWAEWLERGAASRIPLLRTACEAELAFEQWVATMRPHVQHHRRAAAATLGPRLPHARPPAEQRHLARHLLATATVLAVAGLGIAGQHQPGLATPLPGLAQGAAADAGPFDSAGSPSSTEPAPGMIEGPPPSLGPIPDVAGIPALPPVPPAAPPSAPTMRGALPVGKGMWIWLPERTEGGNVAAIVARARAAGLTHVYVRTGTLRDGFVGAPFLDQLLPAAHAAGIRVYAWDFPYLNDVAGDAARALAAINHTTPDGHRVDGYAADIELRSMGVNVTPQTAFDFGATVRRGVGPDYPLIAVVPRPSPQLVRYPFAEVTASFDAIAPMVYWLGRDPATDVTGAINELKRFGKPVIPVGQAYDGSGEGGPPGVPPRAELLRFMTAAEQAGAISVSWWSWQHADQQAWDAVRDAPEFTLPLSSGPFRAGQALAYQGLLTSLGFTTAPTGAEDDGLTLSVAAYQKAARLPVTGRIDELTRTFLLSPFAPPIRPQP